ncbi:aspartate/glutamate racemase family protein [Mycolicibacterium smegmatis]|uniref:maleate cis-trans isomerase family protein n=1 Tax=Mycolicibacterium smegmatis TaxID=1772 RepID=UPI0003268A5A|nr:aspartate/glutamate racemase family protein [Mycolicibacterium smegmatis]MCO4196956.1 aspartate/glutamate racemase family protein [Mycolicibacterium smegmatis]UAK55817.1 aspartate/glutamate racemase family protein [Mycolicibacterium smegmatis]ULN26585.1 Asp/Glu racemase [Mycolicibacterium smegmatis]ULN32822.1 Asp/Glu racemase [Mycolicibacterium smegmatis]ULN67927.1 Asp/Glu racemase [Mycolicibacterium smegmatis]
MTAASPVRSDDSDPNVRKTARIGMIVPSSNTCLEPLTYRMLDNRCDVTVHFTRTPVTRVGLDDTSDAQFDTGAMQAAATLLATADVDLIAWNGTAGSWLGTSHDRAITDAISRATGVRAVTSTLAFMAVFGALGVHRLGIVTPYPDYMNARIGESYRAEGVTVISTQGFGLTETTDIARIQPHELGSPTRHVAAAAPDAIAYVCTNLRGADAVEALEAELGVPVLDSVAVTLAVCLAMVGAAPLDARWGSRLSHGAGLAGETLART